MSWGRPCDRILLFLFRPTCRGEPLKELVYVYEDNLREGRGEVARNVERAVRDVIARDVTF